MKSRTVVMMCCLLLSTTPILAQSGNAVADPISGTWVDPDGSGAGLVLEFDGKRAVTGTVLIAGRSRERNPPIQTGTFNPKTGALKLEGEDTGSDGAPVKYVIEGKLDGGELAGSFAFGSSKGTFRFTKKT